MLRPSPQSGAQAGTGVFLFMRAESASSAFLRTAGVFFRDFFEPAAPVTASYLRQESLARTLEEMDRTGRPPNPCASVCADVRWTPRQRDGFRVRVRDKSPLWSRARSIERCRIAHGCVGLRRRLRRRDADMRADTSVNCLLRLGVCAAPWE